MELAFEMRALPTGFSIDGHNTFNLKCFCKGENSLLWNPI